MKLIIAGSRTLTNEKENLWHIYDTMEENCMSSIDVECVLSGTAQGPDKHGEKWAAENGKMVQLYPANWEEHGKRAGFIRNMQMANEGDTLIALWDGNSAGTKHMIDCMMKLGKRFFVITLNPPAKVMPAPVQGMPMKKSEPFKSSQTVNLLDMMKSLQEV